MSRNVRLYLLTLLLLLPQFGTSAPRPALVQDDDEGIPRNGCIIHNPYSMTITFKVRSTYDGTWEQKELSGGASRTYIGKDYILLGSVSLPLRFKKRYKISWNEARSEWEVRPV